MVRLLGVLLAACFAVLAVTLVLMTGAGRLYRRGELEEAGRRSQRLGRIALATGLLAALSGMGLGARGAGSPGFAAGIALTSLSGMVAGLGGLARKPAPAVSWAWVLAAAGLLATVFSLLP